MGGSASWVAGASGPARFVRCGLNLKVLQAFYKWVPGFRVWGTAGLGFHGVAFGSGLSKTIWVFSLLSAAATYETTRFLILLIVLITISTVWAVYNPTLLEKVNLFWLGNPRP